MHGFVSVRRALRALALLCSVALASVVTSVAIARLGITHRAAAEGRPSAPPLGDEKAAPGDHSTPAVTPLPRLGWRAAKAAPRIAERLAADARAADGWATVRPAHGRPVHVAPPELGSPALRTAAPAPAGTATTGSSRPGSAPALITMLHGMCSEPLPTCELGRGAATELGWYACPTGNSTCGTVADWAGSGVVKARFLEQSLAELDALRPGARGAAAGDVLMGFSRGAFVARDVAYELPGRWVGLVLIGAALVPDADRLLANGIRRVVLASGDFDGARPTMRRAAAVLTLRGLPARFVSLGPIYHTLPADLADRLAPELAWLRANGPTS